MAYKILAVDDNPINLKLIRRALVNSDYEILSAESGKQALEISGNSIPDLILLDVMMDDMDGYEVCKILQEQKETSQIPIIFLSAKNDSVDKTRGLALGAVDYLTKPFDAAELNSRVQTQLKIRKNNILLQRENQKLREQLQSNGAQIEQYLNTIRTDYLSETDSFHCAAQVIGEHLPQTSGFIPLLQDEDQLFFLIVNGSQKDYATLAVELLFEQFASGYCASMKNQPLSHESITDLIQKLMQKFSPDIYPVTFSFAMGWLQRQNRTLTFYGIRQKLPLIMDYQGGQLNPEVNPLSIKGSFSDMIAAHQVTVPEKSLICFYRNGMSYEQNTKQYALFADALRSVGTDPVKMIKKLEMVLPASEADQLISILKIR